MKNILEKRKKTIRKLLNAFIEKFTSEHLRNEKLWWKMAGNNNENSVVNLDPSR